MTQKNIRPTTTKINYESISISLMGICTSLNANKLCWAFEYYEKLAFGRVINEVEEEISARAIKKGLDFEKTELASILEYELIHLPKYQQLREDELECFLYPNKFNNQILFPEQKIADFLLVSYPSQNDAEWQELERIIRKIPGIDYNFTIKKTSPKAKALIQEICGW